MSKKGFTKFLAGAALGAGLGLLFAPKSGKRTRADLKKKFDELLVTINEVDVEEVKNNFNQKIEAIRKEISELDQEKVLKIAKKKAKELEKMANDLVDYALEKGTPVVKEATAVIREKAIEVTKEVLNKLEEKGE